MTELEKRDEFANYLPPLTKAQREAKKRLVITSRVDHNAPKSRRHEDRDKL